MNTSQTRLTLLGIACGILLALLIAPQTRWLVRAQLMPSTLMPNHSGQQKRRFVQAHPSDYQVQLAGEAEGDHRTQLEYGRSLVSRFPNSASLRANILRYATVSEVRLHRNEDYLLQSRPVPAHRQPDPDNSVPTAAHLAAFDADAAAGERLDPDNAYFPFMRSIELFAAHRDAAGLAAVQRASTKHVWREYIEDEVEGRWRLNDAVYGGRDALSAGAVSASLLFPHYQNLRAAARIVVWKAVLDEKAGHPEAGLAKREAVGRCGEIMAVQSTTLIGNLVGAAINMISRSRPGGALPLKVDPRLTNEQETEKRLALYSEYVTKIGHPEAAAQARSDTQIWKQTHQITSDLGDYTYGNRMPDFLHLGAALVAGWAILPNVLSLILLGVLAAGLSRLPRVQQRQPLPAGVTTGFWSITILGLLLIYAYAACDTATAAFFAALLVLVPLGCAALAALLRPRLRRPIAMALATAGASVGLLLLLAALTFWQTQGGVEFLSALRETLSLPGSDSASGSVPENTTAQLLPFFTVLLGLTIPLLLAMVVSIVSRVKRVPVSAGLVTGFCAVMPPLVFVLVAVYGGLVLWTVRQEVRINYGLERSLHGEGQYLAQLTRQSWPGPVK